MKTIALPEKKTKDIIKTSGIFMVKVGNYRHIGFSKQVEVCTIDYKGWLKNNRHPNKEMQAAYDASGGEYEVSILEELPNASKGIMEERKAFWMEHAPADIEPSGTEDRNTLIKQALESGKTVKDVALQFGLSESSIRKIKSA